MAKAEVTRKWVASNYTCCGVGYCDLQFLLRFQSKRFYTCGVYGWNFDVYTFGDYAITTGYRNMVHHVQTKNVSQYDNEARAILNDNSLTWEEQKEKVNSLLEQFLEETFGEKIKVY
jgi:hypothetical protein